MPAFAPVKAHWNKTMQLGRRLRAKLRRERAIVALAITLALGLGEPLVCILHCQLWLPFAFQSYFAEQHQHHQHMRSGGASAAERSALASGSAIMTQPGAPAHLCAFQSDQNNGMPFHIPPSPVHEMLPVFGLLLLGFGLLREHLTDPPGRPPTGSRPQILRPPILSLGRYTTASYM